MKDDSYVGIGKNPNPDMPDIPVGLGMNLMQDADAMNHFNSLSNQRKKDVIKYIQQSNSGDDARYRIKNAICHMHNNDTNFL